MPEQLDVNDETTPEEKKGAGWKQRFVKAAEIAKEKANAVDQELKRRAKKNK